MVRRLGRERLLVLVPLLLILLVVRTFLNVMCKWCLIVWSIPSTTVLLLRSKISFQLFTILVRVSLVKWRDVLKVHVGCDLSNIRCDFSDVLF